MEKTEEALKDLRKQGGIAADLILQTLEVNNVKFGVGMDALQCVYAKLCFENEMPYEEYCDHMNAIKKGYEKLWEKK